MATVSTIEPSATKQTVDPADAFVNIGTPEFDMEYRRQLELLAAHYRAGGGPDLIPLDEEDLKGWV